MDYSKVTMLEYQAKKKAILDSLGRSGGVCDSICCCDCIFRDNGGHNCGIETEMENPLEAIKKVMDYDIPIDWSKVKVDTPILVKAFEKDDWLKCHFAKYKNGLVWAFYNGHTSWTNGGDRTISWEYARLAESEGD